MGDDPKLIFEGVDQTSGMLTEVLSAFTRFIANGGDKIITAEAELCGVLLALQAWRMVMRFGFTKNVGIGVFVDFLFGYAWFQLARNGVAVAAAFMTWAGSIGSYVSGSSIDTDIMHNPSLVVDLGGNAFMAMINQATQFNVMLAPAAFSAYALVGAFLFLCYVALGVIVVLVVVETSIDVMLGLALIPFLIENELRFVAARGLGLILDAGLRLGASSLAIGISYGFLQKIQLSHEASVREGTNLMIAALVCAVVCGGAASVKKAGSLAIGAWRAFR